jgi:hypothetical protein
VSKAQGDSPAPRIGGQCWRGRPRSAPRAGPPSPRDDGDGAVPPAPSPAASHLGTGDAPQRCKPRSPRPGPVAVAGGKTSAHPGAFFWRFQRSHQNGDGDEALVGERQFTYGQAGSRGDGTTQTPAWARQGLTVAAAGDSLTPWQGGASICLLQQRARNSQSTTPGVRVGGDTSCHQCGYAVSRRPSPALDC